MKYRVDFSGFAYVEADDADEAAEKFYDDDHIFSETGIDAVEEVDEFTVRI